MPGWGRAAFRQHEDFVPSHMATDILNMTNRQGIQSYNMGTLSSRPGYADSPKYQLGGKVDDTEFDYPSRFFAKFYPGQATAETDGTYTYKPQVLRLAGAAGSSAFQKFDTSDGDWDNVTADGYVNGSIAGSWYPQTLVYDVPAGPYFCWIDPLNGLHVYDGTTDTKQEIPKYDTAGNITGAMWLAQIDGRLVVTGNYSDTGQRNVLYYSASGDYTKWESHNGGGQIALYADDDENSQTRNITGIVTFHGQLIVFTGDGRFVISGIGTTNQTLRFYPGYGCASGKTISKTQSAIYWWGKDGAYEWNGNEVIEIGQLIMPQLYTLALSSALTFFSFVYEGQWWTNAVRTDGAYRNFVYDFATRQWFIFNIPMVAAWNSQAGLLDAGYLYFASPEAVGGKYKHYIFGVDPLNSHYPVYGDKVTGGTQGGNDRTATDIPFHWTSGRMDFGNYFIKDFWKIHARIAIANSTSIPAAAFTSARVSYNLDDDTGFSDNLDFTQAASTPYHALSFAGTDDVENETNGTLLQIKLNGAGTKRLDIKKVFIEFYERKVAQHET